MNQGTFDLGSAAVTTAVTNSVFTTGTSLAGAAQAFLDRFEGMQHLAIYCDFTYGSGGTTCAVIVQTTLDDVNWLDIARFDFLLASAAKVCNLSAASVEAIRTVAALSAEGVGNDGVLGAKLRAKVTSTGTYAGGTSVACRIAAR